MKKLILTAFVALAFPAAARAGDVALVARDVPLGTRALQAAVPPMRFNMLGVHWRGSGRVDVRTRSLHGAWRPWQEADDDVRPDATSPERDRGWRDGNLLWLGASDAVEFRTNGKVSRLRAFYLWSRVRAVPVRRVSSAGSPLIVPRSGWFADEKIKRAKPSYAPALKFAVVHHTASTNSYTPAQAAAIVRGIEVYHVKGNGWNDIGYNFLIDRYGTVYEGRYGGIDKNVVGAHAEGFNTGSVGVSLIGNFSAQTPPAVQQRALVNLVAWRLDVAHLDPLSTVVYTSGGNAKFRAGKVVTLRAISAHRDTGPTECPGARAYAAIPPLTRRVSETGLPKLYSPVVSGARGGRYRFQARLSSALPWTVSVTGPGGLTVAQGRGRGSLVDWSWDSARAGNGPFAWSIEAGPSVRPATGTIGAGRVVPGPVLTGLAATPAVLAPAADGSGSVGSVVFMLGVAAQVTAEVRDASGLVAATVLREPRAAGANAFEWFAAAIPDGRYRLVVSAKVAGGATVATQSVPVVIDRTLTLLRATPAAMSPNGDGVFDTMTLSFVLARDVPGRIEIRQRGAVLATPFAGLLAAGPHVLDWDGTNAGARLADGAYDAVVTVTDALGDVPFSLPFVLDTAPPALALLDRATLRFQLSEPATVTLLVNDQRIQVVEPQGVFTVPFVGTVTSVSAVAEDAAGNRSATVKSP